MSGVDCVDCGAASVAGAASVVGAAAGAAASVAGAVVSSLMVFMVDTSCPRHRSDCRVAHTDGHTSYRKLL